MPAPRFAILAVCTANICRSPLMEALLCAELDPARFEVASAGVKGWAAEPMDPSAEAELRRLGHTSGSFRSQAIDPYFIETADLILTATRQHRSDVLGLTPGALRRSFTLVEFAALTTIADGAEPAGLVAQAAQLRSRAPSDLDVDDPFRRGPEAHRRAADQIGSAVTTIGRRLNSLVGSPTGPDHVAREFH